MELTEIVAALVLIGLSAHIVVQHRRGVRHKRRESALRHLGDLSRHIEVPEESRPANEPAGQAFDASRSFVPVGLRLEQARRVIREARGDNNDSPVNGPIATSDPASERGLPSAGATQPPLQTP